MWPEHEPDRNVTMKIGSVQWVKFRDSVVRVSWKCDGMKKTHNSYLNIGSDQWVSLLLFQENKPGINKKCSRPTGKLSFNVWNKTKHISSVPFTSHTEGYACFKIPTLLKQTMVRLLPSAKHVLQVVMTSTALIWSTKDHWITAKLGFLCKDWYK